MSTPAAGPSLRVHRRRHGRILNVAVSGRVTPGQFGRVAYQVLQYARHETVHSMLIDVRALVGRPGMLESYLMLLAAPRLLLRLRIAIVDWQNNHDNYRFHQQLAASEGYRLRFFEQRGAAREWIAERGTAAAVQAVTLRTRTDLCH